MGQKKLIRFAELETFPNVLQFPKNIKGKWNEFFRNEKPITLELACGKGEYAVGLGRLYPQKNFIGVDIKGNRIWAGAKKALTEDLNNVAFLRTEIDQLSEYFAKDEVDEIWITFPDPQLRKSKAKSATDLGSRSKRTGCRSRPVARSLRNWARAERSLVNPQFWEALGFGVAWVWGPRAF